MIIDMPKIGWVERLLADVELMTMGEFLAVERQQQYLEREIPLIIDYKKCLLFLACYF